MVDLFLKDAYKGDDEEDDGADVLDNDGCVCHEWPEEVRLEAWISLQLLEEGCLVSVVIRI